MRRYRIHTRRRVAGLHVSIIANLDWLRCGAWQVCNDGQLCVRAAGVPVHRCWVTAHWDALCDALFDAADAFVAEQRAEQIRDIGRWQ